jgi:hypothetical protein
LRPTEVVSSADDITFTHGDTIETLQPSVLGVTGSWGHGVAANEDKFTLFKLTLLHPDDLRQSYRETPEHLAAVQDALYKIDAANKLGIDVVKEYLSRLWAAAKPILLGKLAEEGLDFGDVDVRFVFGIPAVWDDQARSRMKKAIESSGLLASPGRPPAPFAFLPEPEAAAIALLPRLAANHDLQHGQTVLICDCGGGTVVSGNVEHRR